VVGNFKRCLLGPEKSASGRILDHRVVGWQDPYPYIHTSIEIHTHILPGYTPFPNLPRQIYPGIWAEEPILVRIK